MTPLQRTLLVLILIPLFAAAFSLPAFGQEPPVTWGEIPQSDLTMTSYPADTNAAAVILCDYGTSSFNDDLDIIFTRHRRIKILSSRGYDWGTHNIPYYAEDQIERVDNVEGVTYKLDEKGNVVTTEMDDDAIFDEDVDGTIRRVRFTLPALSPGCVIEYRYKVKSSSPWMMPTWEFQTSEPVRWSEYIIRTPKAIAYAAVFQGYEQFHVSEATDVNQFFSGLAQSYLQERIVRCSQRRWVVKDAPAIRHESYMTTPDDYMMKVDLQLVAYAIPGGGIERVRKDWPMYIEDLLDARRFGKRIESSGTIRDLAGQITAGLTSPRAKLNAIYRWVSSSIVWNEQHRVYAEQEVDDVLESKKGSTADITFLLISLLRAAGLQADPLVTSTRENGRVQQLYPIVSQFNMVLTRVTMGRTHSYVDATDPRRPLDLLPEELSKAKGIVIKKGSVEWAAFLNTKRDLSSSRVTLQMADDASLTASIESSLHDYAALRFRRALNKTKKEAEAVQSTLGLDEQAFKIDSVQIEGQDSVDLPVKIEAEVHSSDYAQSAGEFIYLNPHIISRFTENPLKTPTRRFPVDIPYGTTRMLTIKVLLPDDLMVKEGLQNRSVIVSGGGPSFSRRVQIFPKEILISLRYDLVKTDYSSNQYPELRDFFASMTAFESEQLVLQRVSPKTTPKKK